VRRELLVAIGLVALVSVPAWILGSARRQAPVDRDERPSTLLAGPRGARGLAQTLEALGTTVVQLRHPLTRETPLGADATLLVLAPESRVVGPAALRLAEQHQRVPLVLVGGTLRDPMRCFGWTTRPLLKDSAQVVAVGGAPSRRAAPWVRAVLERHDSASVTLRGSVTDGTDAVCRVETPVRTETLVATRDGRPVAVRLHYADAPSVTLAATVQLFRNEVMRTTAAASLAVLVTGVPTRLVVDEEIHGFTDGRPIWKVAGAWVAQHAVGIAAMHAVVVAIVLLLVRGGPRVPPRPLPLPPRRSSAEHVRALAAALAVAGGRAEAVRLLIRGLRRRLGDRRLHRDAADWMADVRPAARSAAARAALDRLAAAQQAPTDNDVLAAARAADDFRHETLP
jgi:hypothetical protein